MVERRRYAESKAARGRWYACQFSPGKGNHPAFSNYVFATNLNAAFQKAKEQRGWEKDLTRHDKPDIVSLSQEESEILEQIIDDLPDVNIYQARKHGLQGVRSSRKIIVERMLEARLLQREIALHTGS